MKLPTISIMIPAYNQEKYISKAIISAIEIEYENIEIVVLDDCSTDKTYFIAKELQQKYSKLKVFRNEKNIGRNGTYRRLLYELAQGDWVIMLDGDDYFFKSNFLSKAIEVIKKNNNIVAVLGGYFKDEEGKLFLRLPEEKIMTGIEVFFKFPDIVYSHGAVLYNRKIAIDINSYRLNIMSDDLESHLRLFLKGKVAFINEPVYVWRIHKFNETVLSGYDKYLDNLKKMIDSVFHYGIELMPEKKAEIEKWRKKVFLKLYVIALSVYAKNEGVPVSKILSEIKEYFNFRYFFLSGLIWAVFAYVFLPKKIFEVLRDWFRYGRIKNLF
ncbi:MAG: glycosyltransferase [Elusimicrobiota bacterium]